MTNEPKPAEIRCGDCVFRQFETVNNTTRCILNNASATINKSCMCIDPDLRRRALLAQLDEETKLDVVDEWLLSIVREVGDESSAYQAVADESGRQWVVELSALRMPRTAAVLGEEDTHDHGPDPDAGE